MLCPPGSTGNTGSTHNSQDRPTPHSPAFHSPVPLALPSSLTAAWPLAADTGAPIPTINPGLAPEHPLPGTVGCYSPSHPWPTLNQPLPWTPQGLQTYLGGNITHSAPPMGLAASFALTSTQQTRAEWRIKAKLKQFFANPESGKSCGNVVCLQALVLCLPRSCRTATLAALDDERHSGKNNAFSKFKGYTDRVPVNSSENPQSTGMKQSTRK